MSKLFDITIIFYDFSYKKIFIFDKFVFDNYMYYPLGEALLIWKTVIKNFMNREKKEKEERRKMNNKIKYNNIYNWVY